MATDSIMAGLFQDPQQYQQAQLQQQMKQNYEIAQMTPEQQVTGGLRTAGYQLGQGLGGLMGAEDPQMKLQSLRTQALQGMDPTSSASITQASQKLAQAGDQQGAIQLAQKALEIRNTESQISGRTEQREADRADKMTMFREKIEAGIKTAEKEGATKKEIEQMRLEGRMQLAQLAASIKGEKAQVADDKAATRIGQNTVFENIINEGDDLTKVIDKNKDSFSLGGRAATAIKSVMSPSSPSVQALSDVDSYLKKARNAYLLAAKGTQTEGDAQRAWEEFSGRLDFSSAEGAKRSVERIQTELRTQKQSNEAYLKSRGISSGAALGSRDNPIKLK